MHSFPSIRRPSSLFFVLLLLLLLLGFLSFPGKALPEKSILLKFKASVSDPSGILASWVPLNDSSEFEHCLWRGVSCDSQFRVSSLKIYGGDGGNGKHLLGKDLGFPCFNVSQFPFYGIGIRRSCYGRNGKLIGELSPVIAKLKKLRVLSLPFHEFSGEIPSEIWGLEDLEVLDLEGNLISGQLPVSVKGLRRLRVLNLGLNRVVGHIPNSLSGLVGLELLNLAGNQLAGLIPPFVGCYRKLWGLYLSMNQLEGGIPDVWGSNCRNLRYLDLSSNALYGKILHSLGNCRKLQVLLLASNALQGVVPRELSRLRKLEVLDVSRNRLRGHIPAELGNCTDMSVLVLSNLDDPFSANGKCGDASGYGESNLFRGSIPMEIVALPKLRIIWAPKAGFQGEILSNWGGCENLEMINLSQNSFTGEADGALEGCRNLAYVNLRANKVSERDTENIHTSSLVERSGGGVTGYSVCDSLLSRVSSSVNLNKAPFAYLSFFVNGACLGTYCSLSKTELLQMHQFGDEGAANVPGKVRKPANARSLSEFNPSSDEAVSSSSVQSSAEDLQANAESPSVGDPNDVNRLNSIEIASIVSASVIVLVLFALVVLFIYTRKCAPGDSSRVQVYERREIKVFTNIGVPLTFQHVVKATDCFSAGNCIGCGGFGATYKAEISPGVVVAVKRLAVGRFHCIQQFHAEIKTLGRIRHSNLVTLIGYHASETEMFLIYNYLPGGNLEKFIQERSSKFIKWNVIHKIALDIAHAIAYLHDECNPRVIHRDVKPSNILLDNDFNAYLSDFGLSRLLENSETHATTGVAGTFGYLAPEYAMTCRVSEKADVYSYGVVLLELISDKKALDPSFSAHGNGFNIVSWAHMLLRQGRAKEVFTAGIWESGPHDDLVEVLHLAVKCTVDSLTIRPTMKQVVQLLKQLRPIS